MIVARAIGVTALDLFDSMPFGRDGPPAFAVHDANAAADEEFGPPLEDDLAARLHRVALVVPLLRVPTPSVRLGPALQADPSSAPGHRLDAGLRPGPLT